MSKSSEALQGALDELMDVIVPLRKVRDTFGGVHGETFTALFDKIDEIEQQIVDVEHTIMPAIGLFDDFSKISKDAPKGFGINENDQLFVSMLPRTEGADGQMYTEHNVAVDVKTDEATGDITSFVNLKGRHVDRVLILAGTSDLDSVSDNYRHFESYYIDTASEIKARFDGLVKDIVPSREKREEMGIRKTPVPEEEKRRGFGPRKPVEPEQRAKLYEMASDEKEFVPPPSVTNSQVEQV